jgi:hypothetical protein
MTTRLQVVREVLCELEIPHVFHSCARGSPKRQELFAMTGTFQAPYLEDPVSASLPPDVHRLTAQRTIVHR